MTTKLYRITEDDLAVLESELPRILEFSSMSCNDPVNRKRWQMVREIISNVRWDYGPPLEVHRISSENETDS